MRACVHFWALQASLAPPAARALAGDGRETPRDPNRRIGHLQERDLSRS